MPTYTIEFAVSARKELRKLTPPVRRRLLAALYKLADNPRRGPVRPMVGSKSWRLRAGDYRAVYDIQDDRLIVLVLRVGHRRGVYRP